MTYYIRKENLVYAGMYDDFDQHRWSEIYPTTTQMTVMAFTTRADAQNFLKSLSGIERIEDFYGAVPVNNLEFEL
jgi:hypothetical protein